MVKLKLPPVNGKKFFAVIISVIFAAVLTSCKSNESINTSNNTQAVTSNNDTSESKPNTDKKADNTSTTEKPSVKEKKCRVYFFNMSQLKHYYIEKTLPVENNALVTALTKELQNNSYNKDFLSLTDKVKIKSAKVDEKTGVLKVVFNDSYVNNMNLGSSTESGLLTSLIATYGYNLGVDKIAIYFNNELYTCLKGDLAEGYFTVEYPAAELYKQ